MKSLIITCSFLLFSVYSFSQHRVEDLKSDSTKMYIEYVIYTGFINDSIFSTIGKGFLFLGNKGSVYTFQQQPVEVFLKKMGESIEDEKMRKVVIDGMKKRDLEKQQTNVYAKFYDSPDFLNLKVRDDGDIWYSDTVEYKFKPVNEFKDVSGYRCQKALGHNRNGNEVIVWFAEKIPISSGPFMLSGLPGLILECESPERKVLYKAVSISSTSIPPQRFRNWLTGPIMNKSQYGDEYEKSMKKLKQLQQMIESGKTQNQ